SNQVTLRGDFESVENQLRSTSLGRDLPLAGKIVEVQTRINSACYLATDGKLPKLRLGCGSQHKITVLVEVGSGFFRRISIQPQSQTLRTTVYEAHSWSKEAVTEELGVRLMLQSEDGP